MTFTGHHPAHDRTDPVRLPGYQNHGFGVAASYGAALWSVAFALLHLFWLFGGRLGLPDGLSVVGNTPLLIIDLVAVPLCAFAAVLALALVRPWGWRIPRRLLLTITWGTSALLVPHAAPTIVDWVRLVSGHLAVEDLDGMTRMVTFLYEPIFLSGGLLFGLACLGCLYRRHPA